VFEFLTDNLLWFASHGVLLAIAFAILLSKRLKLHWKSQEDSHFLSCTVLLVTLIREDTVRGLKEKKHLVHVDFNSFLRAISA